MSGDRDGRKAGFARLLAAAALAASLMLGINLAWNLHEANPSPQPPAAAVPAKAVPDVVPAPSNPEPRSAPKRKRVTAAARGPGAPATVATPAPAATPVPHPALSEAEKIDRLIAYIGGLQGAVFIRNGDEHTPQEAVQHLQMKRDKAGDRVKTAEDFIQLCASRSFLSGKPYLIRFADGRTRTSEEVLREELARMGP